MRVIGGEYRSRRLKTIPGLATRPTPDRLRETLFDILAGRVEGAVFVDAYAGSGAVGIEALSRGAARCIFLEISRKAVEAIRENLRALGIETAAGGSGLGTGAGEVRARVVAGKVVATLGRHPADIEGGAEARWMAEIVFLDPPYEMAGEYAAALGALGLAPPGLVVVQHSVRFDPGDVHGLLRRVRVLKQGDNALSFYERG
jgi:16S rRNA G966 N2-methylase RsmD